MSAEVKSASHSASATSSNSSSTAKPPSKARWGLLKRALVGSANSGTSADSSGSSVSVRRHEGFQLFRHEILTEEQILALNPPAFNTNDFQRYQYQRFSLLASSLVSSPSSTSPSSPSSLPAPSDNNLRAMLPPCCFRVRRPDSVKLSELAPDQKVDNTGNICIWNSEEILAHVAVTHLLRQAREGSTATTAPRPDFDPNCIADSATFPANPPIDYPDLPPCNNPARPLRILELGAGMSGLCAIALASAASQAPSDPAESAVTAFESVPTSTPSSSPCIESILITDGNEGCMEEVKFQIAWNAALKNLSPSVSVDCQTLVWDRRTDYSNLGKFDLILAADCLFFEKYHVDLCHVLRSLLVPHTGRACLLAPSRGGSLQRFMQRLIQPSCAPKETLQSLEVQTDEQHFTKGLRITQLSHRYDEEIWKQHQQFLREEENRRVAFLNAESMPAESVTPPTYSIDLHTPLLLTLACQS